MPYRARISGLDWSGPPDSYVPRAMFGGLLWGNAAVRYIFVDEAGISAKEPVSVVVGLTVDADRQLLFAETAVRDVLGGVPPEFRGGFVFHASDIWGTRYRSNWALADRLAVLRAMMMLPRRLGIPISVGMVRRGGSLGPAEMSVAEFDHVIAFHACITRADKYIRDHGAPNEVATVVAEDNPRMRRFLRNITKSEGLRAGFTLPPGMLKPTLAEQEAGFISQESENRISRIRHAIHFVEKGDDPMLQLADACAFGLRRFFSELEYGHDFAVAINGTPPPLSDWSGPMNAATFYPPDSR